MKNYASFSSSRHDIEILTQLNVDQEWNISWMALRKEVEEGLSSFDSWSNKFSVTRKVLAGIISIFWLYDRVYLKMIVLENGRVGFLTPVETKHYSGGPESMYYVSGLIAVRENWRMPAW